KVAIKRVVLLIATRQNTALSELEYQELAPRLVVDQRRERSNTRILVADGEASLPLVRCDQIEIFEFRDVAPAACHLTICHAVDAFGDGIDQLRNRSLIEDSVTEIGVDDGIDGPILHPGLELGKN